MDVTPEELAAYNEVVNELRKKYQITRPFWLDSESGEVVIADHLPNSLLHGAIGVRETIQKVREEADARANEIRAQAKEIRKQADERVRDIRKKADERPKHDFKPRSACDGMGGPEREFTDPLSGNVVSARPGMISPTLGGVRARMEEFRKERTSDEDKDKEREN